jgi:hypothetical protein
MGCRRLPIDTEVWASQVRRKHYYWFKVTAIRTKGVAQW